MHVKGGVGHLYGHHIMGMADGIEEDACIVRVLMQQRIFVEQPCKVGVCGNGDGVLDALRRKVGEHGQASDGGVCGKVFEVEQDILVFGRRSGFGFFDFDKLHGCGMDVALRVEDMDLFVEADFAVDIAEGCGAALRQRVAFLHQQRKTGLGGRFARDGVVGVGGGCCRVVGL